MIEHKAFIVYADDGGIYELYHCQDRTIDWLKARVESLEESGSTDAELIELIPTTAIKDLPPDKLVELGVMRIEDNEPPKGIHNIFSCPECGDSGKAWKPTGDSGDFPKFISCPCLKNPNSIASIKRGGSDNAKRTEAVPVLWVR